LVEVDDDGRAAGNVDIFFYAGSAMKNVEVQLPFILVKTERVISVLDRLGRSRFLKPLGSVLVYIVPFAAAVSLYLVVTSIIAYLTRPEIRVISRSLGFLSNLLIPGLNPVIPLLYGWITLIVAVVVHESAHGILARSLGIPVKSAGLIFLAVLWIGAFVEIDEERLKAAKFKDSARTLAGGPGVNVLVAFASLALLLFTVSTLAPRANGLGVLAVDERHIPAQVGLSAGDIIVGMNNTSITSLGDLIDFIDHSKPNDTVMIQALHGDTYTEYVVPLIANENNRSQAVLPIQPISLRAVLEGYMLTDVNVLKYLLVPTIPGAQFFVPYSDVMKVFYTSPLGEAAYILSNLFFWTWFMNFNLAIFNALPLYPFDGGRIFLAGLEAAGKGRIGHRRAWIITVAISIVMISLIVSMIAIPYILT